jgi:hypothetical protein
MFVKASIGVVELAKQAGTLLDGDDSASNKAKK